MIRRSKVIAVAVAALSTFGCSRSMGEDCVLKYKHGESTGGGGKETCLDLLGASVFDKLKCSSELTFSSANNGKNVIINISNIDARERVREDLTKFSVRPECAALAQALKADPDDFLNKYFSIIKSDQMKGGKLYYEAMSHKEDGNRGTASSRSEAIDTSSSDSVTKIMEQITNTGSVITNKINIIGEELQKEIKSLSGTPWVVWVIMLFLILLLFSFLWYIWRDLRNLMANQCQDVDRFVHKSGSSFESDMKRVEKQVADLRSLVTSVIKSGSSFESDMKRVEKQVADLRSLVTSVMDDREKIRAAPQTPLERQRAPQQIHPLQSLAAQGDSRRSILDDLIDSFNVLIKDRNLEDEFRRIWNPTPVTLECSAVVPVSEDDKGSMWLIKLPREKTSVLTPTRRVVTRDLTALTAVRGEGARRLLGEAFDIGSIKDNKTDPVLESVAAVEITDSEVRIRERGRLLLPLPA